MRHRQTLAMAAGLVVLASTPARGVEQEQIDRAVNRGVQALRALQAKDGTWLYAGHEYGMTSLAALTLLECGAKPDDPAVRVAAAAVRGAAPKLSDTYSLALAILFFDRLGNPADAPLIQVLGIRLLFGQTSAGAWGYDCPCLARDGELRFLKGTNQTDVPSRKGTLPSPLEKETSGIVPAGMQEILAAYATAPRSQGLEDHSNSQFATIGLWVARRYKVPVDRALKALEGHYRQCQNLDGGWSYRVLPAMNPRGAGSTPMMTAAGLLALATGDGTSLDLLKQAGKPTQASQVKDPLMAAGLRYLGEVIGKPVGPRAFTTPGLIPLATGRFYYFLWSLERVAMCLGLDTVGRKDWFNWGAEILIVNQDAINGLWKGEYTESGADTCFALLFLKRSNLVKDLSVHLRGMFHDPGQVTLRSGSAGPEPGAAGKTSRLNADVASGREDSNSKPIPTDLFSGNGQDGKRPPASDSEAGRLTAQIVATPPAKLDDLLGGLRDAKGVVNTEALAAAVPLMPRDLRKKVRDALAERLSRMRVSSLENYLKDDDPEIRRASALALAMRDSRESIPALIKLLNDPQETVALGAHAALKALTGESIARDAAKWSEWWKKHGSGR